MSSKITIGYYDESTGHGGTTRYLLELLQAIDRSKFEPVFFSTSAHPWHSTLRNMGIEIVTLQGEAPIETSQPPSPTAPPSKKSLLRSVVLGLIPPHIKWSRGIARDTERLVELFQKRRVDLLHSNQTGAEVGPIAARRAGVPIILGTWHVDSTYDLDNEHSEPHHRKLERDCMTALDHAIAVSESTRKDWIQRCGLGDDYRKKTTVIYNGIDVDKVSPRKSKQEARAELNLPTDKVILGSLGRLDAAKGYEYLIRALPKVIAAFPDVLVVIAGRGALQVSLQQWAVELGVDKNVLFYGFTSDINTFLESLDIYVQPSLCEALGFGIIEASAMKLPVVASDIGGIPEVVVPGKTGLLASVKDSDSIANHLITLLQNETLRLQMGEAGRQQAVSKFTNTEMATRTFDLYDQILRDHNLKS